MKPSNSKMPTSSSDETSSANTFNSFVDNTTAGTMTNISLTSRASLESTSTITPPSQHSEDGNGKHQSRQHSNHYHDPHSPPCSPPGSPDHHQISSSHDQQTQQEDQQQMNQDQDPDQDPSQQEQSQPQQQHQPSPSTSTPPPSAKSSTETNTNPNNKGNKTALNEFITRSRSSTLYTPSDNERDEQIRIAILMRCLDMEERFQVQADKYWGCLQ